ncbi:MAG: tRNA pseudouridine(13) synthase TruD [Epsilonproteobacteria bacterium]|nr:tRNA pseudouridine(13) synthase TruD [Campylobacterota bacterium]NPA88629.1 tRNA pseudouridine(13) synthase TruD [Campylobacterota bacterium]
MLYYHTGINFHFNKNSKNFVVEEIPLYPFAHTGQWLMLKVRKKGLSTPEMLKILSSATGVKLKDIGYAGLKDKEGLTLQWISVPREYREKFRTFSHPQIKIVEEDLHRNKLKIGHLKGNRFFVRLKKVLPSDAKKLNLLLKEVKKFGIPNFFGEQRFGKFGDNWKEGKEIVEGRKKVRDRRLRKFLINAYQSKLFNDWLLERIKLSNLFELSPRELEKLGYSPDLIKFVKSQSHPFKLLPGEVMVHYPFGKFFLLEGEEEPERFAKQEITFTGALPGRKVKRSEKEAWEIEKNYFPDLPTDGDRRAGWIFPEILEKEYLKDYAQYNLSFFLPKGSYATTLLKLLKEGVTGFEEKNSLSKNSPSNQLPFAKKSSSKKEE